MKLSHARERTGPQLAAVLVVTLALALATASPASAGKPDKGGSGGSGGDSGGSTVQQCVDLKGDSFFLDEVRAAIGAEGTGLTGAGVGVAVLDTGINPVAGLEGHVDGVDLSFDSQTDNLRHMDLFGHGTAMASIAAAGPTFAGGGGVAPGAHVVDVKVGAGDGSVDVSQVIAGIDWVVANKDVHDIDVLLLAYNTDGVQDYVLDPLTHAVESAWEHGVTVVVAGGNDGRSVDRLGNPAYNPRVIAVGATEEIVERGKTKHRVPSWSSTGDGVRDPDVVAPGTALFGGGVAGGFLATNYPDAVCEYGGEVYMRGSGTSHAAAVTAGAAALLLEQRPELTPDQVKHLLTSTAEVLLDDRDEPRPEHQQGHGMIDIAAAAAAPIPGLEAVQTHATSTGLGSLQEARGSMVIGDEGDQLSGELTAFGTDFDAAVWAPLATAGTAWTDVTIATDGTMATGTWNGATWSGATWSGATWSGATWSGATWSGATWSGATWSGATWSGATWSGATWSGATWSGATWTGASWTGASWTGASWT